MKRLGLAILVAIWGAGVLAGYLLMPTWLGWGLPDSSGPGSVPWYIGGLFVMAGLFYVPIGSWKYLADRDSRRDA